MTKKVDKNLPDSFIGWLETRSMDELQSIAFNQYVEILRLEQLVEHLKTQTRANAIDQHRDEYINMRTQPDPWDGSIPTDKDIAEKAGTTIRVVRGMRNNSGMKKPKGRPKKTP
jgi:hypothetical protein